MTTDELLQECDDLGLILTRAANPPVASAKYSVWDSDGRSGYGPELVDALADYKERL